jgi:hypothetical protein
MTNAKADFHDASSKSLEEQPPARKKYRSPELALYGNLAELTRSRGGLENDFEPEGDSQTG